MLESKTLQNISVPNAAVIWPSDRQITEAIQLIVRMDSPRVEVTLTPSGAIISAPDDVDLDEAERRIEAVTKALYTMTEMVSEIVRDNDMRPTLHVTNFNWVAL